MSHYRPNRDCDIEAKVTAFPTNQGGRRHPFFSGYRPNHDFGLRGELNDAVHEYPGSGEVKPGATEHGLLWFLAPERQSGRLFCGMEFTVQEGGQIVGKGVITRVVNVRLERPPNPV